MEIILLILITIGIAFILNRLDKLTLILERVSEDQQEYYEFKGLDDDYRDIKIEADIARECDK